MIRTFSLTNKANVVVYYGTLYWDGFCIIRQFAAGFISRTYPTVAAMQTDNPGLNYVLDPPVDTFADTF